MADRSETRWQRALSPQYRDFWLIVLNGVLVRLYFEVFSPKRVIAAFVTQLTGSEWMVGLALAIPPATSCLPMLLFSHRMEGCRERMRYYAWGAQVKWVSQFSLLILVLAIPHRPMLLALLFIAMTGVFGLGDAVGGPAFGDIVARAIRPGLRGRMFGLRVAIGGVLALFAGELIRRVLDPASPLHFPYNYFLLFAVAFAFLVAAQFSFMRVAEPPLERELPPLMPLREYLREAARVLRGDRNAWRYCVYRNLSPFAWVPAAFIIPYALKHLHFSPGVVGTLVSTSVVGSSVSNLGWGSLGDRYGNRIVLVLSAGMLMLAALVLALTPAAAQVLDHSQLLWWLVVVNAFGEIGLVGMGNGQLNYLYDLAPDDRVPLYVGVVATAAAPMAVLTPLIIGWAAQRFDYLVIFTIGLVFSIVVWLAALSLGEPRPGRAARRR